jgi:CheY-like chemotaxis protein
MAAKTRPALVISTREWIGERLAEVLPEFTLRFAPSTELAIPMVQEHAFQLVAVDYPARGQSFRLFLAAMRRRGAPCEHTPVVAMSEPETLDDAEAAFDRGAVRILNPFAAGERLRTAILEVLEHPVRHKVRAVVKLTPADAAPHVRILSQTENVSSSGMLVRYDKLLPIGGRLAFDLELPGQPNPIRGEAAVVRLVFNATDELTGFGARFVGFEGDGRRRLEAALTSLPTPKPAAKAGG